MKCPIRIENFKFKFRVFLEFGRFESIGGWLNALWVIYFFQGVVREDGTWNA